MVSHAHYIMRATEHNLVYTELDMRIKYHIRTKSLGTLSINIGGLFWFDISESRVSD